MDDWGCPGFFCMDLSGLVQMVFWLVASCLAILTYRQAKRSVFQPLRVEVFKLQISLLTRITELLALKQEHQLREHFDLEECLRWNTFLMAEAYDAHAFGIEPVEGHDVRSLNRDVITGAIMPIARSDLFEIVSAPSANKAREEPQVPELLWSDYEHLPIATTKACTEAISEVEAFLRDPLLPDTLRPALEELGEAVQENLTAIGGAVTQAAQQMPLSYPDAESAGEKNLGWVVNIWNRQTTPLEPIADRIVEQARAFLQTERAGFEPRRRGDGGS